MLHQRNIGSSLCVCVCELVQQNAFDPTISNTFCNGSWYDALCNFVACASLYSQRILGWETSQSEAGASAQVRGKGCAWLLVAGDLDQCWMISLFENHIIGYSRYSLVPVEQTDSQILATNSNTISTYTYLNHLKVHSTSFSCSSHKCSAWDCST